MSFQFADVIIDLPTRELNSTFEYKIPHHLADSLTLGAAVSVPFKGFYRIGYVVGLKEKPLIEKHSLIENIIKEPPFLTKEKIELAFWIANYYFSSLSEAFKLFLPPGHSSKVIQEIKLSDNGAKVKLKENLEERLILLLKKKKKVTRNFLEKEFGSKINLILRKLSREKIIELSYKIKPPQIKQKVEKWLFLSTFTNKEDLMGSIKSIKKQKVLEILLNKPKIAWSELRKNSEASWEDIKWLAKKELIKIEEKPLVSQVQIDFPIYQGKITLNEEQKKAIREIEESIKKEKNHTFLLQGVTGSGKTEIYIQSISTALTLQKTALVIVPEIALTPQLVQRFKFKFGDLVATLHSSLSLRERYEQWAGIRDGKYKVVVGARSALFSPLKNLGVIVVDEEHETTYKQNRNPRYHAREVAIQLGKLSKAVVILGSATPSLESYFLAKQKVFQHLVLTKRAGQMRYPQVEVVDMKREFKEGNKGVFSRLLKQEIERCLEGEKKIILFLNRRGYSTSITCCDCGQAITCKRCAVTLVYHQDKKVLLCHHCGYAIKVPQTCPFCGGYFLTFYGFGTQRVESELLNLFPEVRVVRMDIDTTRGRDAHRKRLIEFLNSKKTILLGTQMIAKGLDFPQVSLVGVINADTLLHLPDFRSGERTFQLLMQVGGRAGRSEKPGKVIIQTFLPESYPIKSVINSSYDSFYQREISFRRELGYPPFFNLTNFIVSGKDEEKVNQGAFEMEKEIKKLFKEGKIKILGPAPCPIPKIKGMFRWHITVKNLSISERERSLLERVIKKLSSKGLRIIVDVNPVWML